jgi:hypothetical protein
MSSNLAGIKRRRDGTVVMYNVVFGSDKPYFGSVDRQYILEDPEVVVRGDRVLHLRYRVRR